MSNFAAEIPDVIVKPGKMLGQWGPRAKAVTFLLAVALYGYLLLIIKTIFLKDQRLDRIAISAADTEKMIEKLQTLEQKLGAEIDVMDSLHDY